MPSFWRISSWITSIFRCGVPAGFRNYAIPSVQFARYGQWRTGHLGNRANARWALELASVLGRCTHEHFICRFVHWSTAAIANAFTHVSKHILLKLSIHQYQHTPQIIQITQNVTSTKAGLQFRMRKNRRRLGLRPKPHWRSSQRSPRSPAGLRGTLRGRGRRCAA